MEERRKSGNLPKDEDGLRNMKEMLVAENNPESFRKVTEKHKTEVQKVLSDLSFEAVLNKNQYKTVDETAKEDIPTIFITSTWKA